VRICLLLENISHVFVGVVPTIFYPLEPLETQDLPHVCVFPPCHSIMSQVKENNLIVHKTDNVPIRRFEARVKQELVLLAPNNWTARAKAHVPKLDRALCAKVLRDVENVFA